LLDGIQGHIWRIDEYEYFGRAVQLMGTNAPNALEELISALSEQYRNNFHEILQSRRIAISKNGEKLTVARLILKSKSSLMESSH